MGERLETYVMFAVKYRREDAKELQRVRARETLKIMLPQMKAKWDLQGLSDEQFLKKGMPLPEYDPKTDTEWKWVIEKSTTPKKFQGELDPEKIVRRHS